MSGQRGADGRWLERFVVTKGSTLRFLGAAGTVTGSKHLVETGQASVLLDCGLFQGMKELRLRNWDRLPFSVAALDAVVLSHAHIDHSGCLPLLAREGYRGPIFCSAATAELLKIVLPDSAHLQEEDAERANRRGYTKHRIARPLYTGDDAEAALQLLVPCEYGKQIDVARGVSTILRRAGHILGSATVELRLDAPASKTLGFSGDLGRWGRPILRDPEPMPHADVLLVESTYGDRTHETDPMSVLARIVNEAVDRGGALIIPAFSIGRTQELVWRLRELEDSERIPRMSVFMDSPMAINVTALYCRHPTEHDLEMQLLMDEARCPLCSHSFHLARTRDESKALNRFEGPLIIISASGMATGGRVLHHLAQRLPDPRTTVLLSGFQARGTRGHRLQEGATTLRIHGRDVPVRAKIETLHGLSAHADRDEILRWLGGFGAAPQQTYIVHGEPSAADALCERIRERLGWSVRVAVDAEKVTL